jgi:hypothetical protein
MWQYKDFIAVVLTFISIVSACTLPNIMLVLVISVVCSIGAVYLSFFYKG